ncbi:MAG: AI-2E family transporter, partial [Actinobacteria bacterium]|nr:AI-2E family transporter [Actinomycetota bacterium]
MPSDRLRQAALIVWIAVGSVVIGYVAIILADSVRVIWLPIAFAAGLVFLLEPAVGTFERLGIPRIAGTILSFLILAALIVAAITLIFPPVREQAIELGQQLPELYLEVINWLRDIGARLGVDVEELLTQQTIEDWLNDPANQETIQNLLIGFGAGAGQLIRGVTEAVAIIALAPVLALYILIDLDRFKKSSLALTPPRY